MYREWPQGKLFQAAVQVLQREITPLKYHPWVLQVIEN